MTPLEAASPSDPSGPPAAAGQGQDVSEANPFPGPKPYGRDQRGLFFGRTSTVEELTSLVLSSSLVVVHAQSGFGKSSLLEAGLLPSLEEFDVAVLPAVRVGRVGTAQQDDVDDCESRPANPFVRLIAATVLDSGDADGDSATSETLSGVLGRARRQEAAADRLMLLILDQFEEIFLDGARWQQRTQFLSQLRQAVESDSWLRVVIAIRNDYLANLIPHEADLPTRLVTRYGLESLQEAAAREVITEAFERSGLPIARADVEDVLDRLLAIDVGQPPGLTVRGQYVNLIQLQILCRRLWQSRAGELASTGSIDPDGGNTLAQDRVPDLSTTMRSFVDDAIAEVVAGTRARETAVRTWLQSLITPAGHRAIVSIDPPPAGLPPATIEALEHSRVLQLEQRNRSRWAELTHDSMVSAVRNSNGQWRTARRRRRLRWGALAVLTAVATTGFGVGFWIRQADPARPSLQYVINDDAYRSIDGRTLVGFTGQPDGPITFISVSLGPRQPTARPDNFSRVSLVELASSGQPGRTLVSKPVNVSQFTGLSLAGETTPGKRYAVEIDPPVGGKLWSKVSGWGARLAATVPWDDRHPTVDFDVDEAGVAVRLPAVGVLVIQSPQGAPDTFGARVIYPSTQRIGIRNGAYTVYPADDIDLSVDGPYQTSLDVADTTIITAANGSDRYVFLSPQSTSGSGSVTHATARAILPSGTLAADGHPHRTRSDIATTLRLDLSAAHRPVVVTAFCDHPAAMTVIDRVGRIAGSPISHSDALSGSRESSQVAAALFDHAGAGYAVIVTPRLTPQPIFCVVAAEQPATIAGGGTTGVPIAAGRTNTARTVLVPADAVLIASSTSAVDVSLACPDSSTESGKPLVTIIPRRTPCILFAVRPAAAASRPVSVPLRVVPVPTVGR